MNRNTAEALSDDCEADFDKIVSESLSAYIEQQLSADLHDMEFLDVEELAELIDGSLRTWVREQLENDIDLMGTDR
tara:strand:+ start:70 stop:297 length:228 start_codon:yes stop_codon:yes gene_type:complete